VADDAPPAPKPDEDEKPKVRAIAKRPAFEPPERFLGETENDYRSRAFCMELAERLVCMGPVKLIDVFDAGWRYDPSADWRANEIDVAQWYDHMLATWRQQEAPDVAEPEPPPVAVAPPVEKPRGEERQGTLF
jgi:hypothetical protein